MKLLLLSFAMACQAFAFASQAVCQVAAANGELAAPQEEQADLQTSIPAQPKQPQGPAPDTPSASERSSYLTRQTVTFVEVPVAVKDQKNHSVSGLTFRDFQVYEDGQPQHLKFFSVYPTALSVVFVIDQSVSRDVMQKINQSLSAIPGSLANHDEAAIVTYDDGPRVVTDFTGTKSTRLSAALESSKQSGRHMEVPVDFASFPREAHTLNDAIFAAAKMLSTREKGRHRVICVITDSKERGSKISQISQKDVIRYLETYQITVYGTLVGDAVLLGEGKLELYHAPFQASDILPKYVMTTGGSWNTEFSVNGIETSYVRLLGEARNRYTLGYDTRESVYDDNFRSIELRVLRPNLKVIASTGYYPSVQVLH